jgi:hypothetical protein
LWRANYDKAARSLDSRVTKSPSPKIAKAVPGIVAVLALASAFHYYLTVDKRNQFYQDPRMTYQIGIQSERLSGVMEMVPADAVVGYVTDLPPRLDAHWPTNDEFIFTAVRYELAPRLVMPLVAGQMQTWVLGNFSKPVDLEQIERQYHLKLVKDFGSGVILFQGE